jgi:LacI family transcriptional regulator
MSKKQVTLSDLAKELGISTATVSRALKDYPDISADTKRRVLELSQKWNYRPNTMAAGLRKRESKVIGVIIPSIVNHFFSSVIKGIMEVAYDRDYRVMICQSDESYEKEVTDARALLSSRVDGLLVSLAHETDRYDHFDEFVELGTPVVFFDKVPPSAVFSTVVVDDFQGAHQAVNHLIEQGHRRIAHFRGPLLASTSRARYEGYRQALADHQIPWDESLIYPCEAISFEEGQRFTQELFEQAPDTTAIFTVTDTVGMGAITQLKQLGLAVPQQVAVLGFSNWFMAQVIDPPLSSVAQPSQEMGKLATELLLREIVAGKLEQPFEHENIMLPTQLVVRASSLHVPG